MLFLQTNRASIVYEDANFSFLFNYHLKSVRGDILFYLAFLVCHDVSADDLIRTTCLSFQGFVSEVLNYRRWQWVCNCDDGRPILTNTVCLVFYSLLLPVKSILSSECSSKS
ncbi:hypothetical protein CEXT_513321 [Caerostris extrusa]|uniref:Uncharacterized protein n=1 Tax=Caerostris extrusa TaxID=172846 RepID=A0AAV4VBB9_CAEEX|nr:hypothetical protein CEXT_513321 [Caerostris extrusa]